MDLGSPDTPRWVQRFDNFARGVLLLREGLDIDQERGLSQLEKEGLIQRFEYTWELAWKTLKDVLEYQGINLPTATPRAVVREAFAANIISDGDVWMAALDARNKMSHTYDFRQFEKVLEQLRSHFMALFEDLYSDLMTKRHER